MNFERHEDYLHISLGNYAAGSIRDTADSRRRTPLVLEKIAGRVPLMAVGSIETPQQAELPIRDGATLIAVGRAALCDPDWPAKVRAGHAADLRRCVPAEHGDEICTLPPPLYERILARPGWVKVCGKW